MIVTNLAVECLHHTLLKLEKRNKTLPRVLYLQLDNGPDQKSRQFLSFIAYLVHMKVFDKIKVSYLVVGHTHEDIDQYFSCISRYIRKFLGEVFTISAFLEAIRNCFTTPACIPLCIERILYCYDTLPLADHMDPRLARFAVPEKTGDNVHHMVFQRDTDGNVYMQYKMYHYSNALYPRKYDVGSQKISQRFGEGVVTAAAASRDTISKKKFWSYTVQFKNCADSTTFSRIYRLPAERCRIMMFPNHDKGQKALLPQNFDLASFNDQWQENMEEQKKGVATFLKAMQFGDTEPEVIEEWNDFWQSFVPDVASVENVQPFLLPAEQPFHDSCGKRPLSCVDDGTRNVQVVEHSGFTNTDRQKALKRTQALKSSLEMEKLHQGDFVVLDLTPVNCSAYTLSYLIAEIECDISTLDTTDPTTCFQVQVYRPTDLVSIEKKLVRWKGDDNQLWKPTVSRSIVKAIVEITPRGKKLTKKSLDIVRSF